MKTFTNLFFAINANYLTHLNIKNAIRMKDQCQMLISKERLKSKCWVGCSSLFYGIIKVSWLLIDVYFASVKEWVQ